jgi:8-oxo-dGTP diphosphatase
MNRTIHAAGGIVFRRISTLEVAVVQLSKYRQWVLPKGKLKRNEKARGAAKREVLEETGHRVEVHEFLGVLSYESRGKSKIVRFWRMQALGNAVRAPASDIKEVRWLSVKRAMQTLTHPRERIFLRHAVNSKPVPRRRKKSS